MRHNQLIAAIEDKHVTDVETELIVKVHRKKQDNRYTRHVKFYQKQITGTIVKASKMKAQIKMADNTIIGCHIADVPTSRPSSNNRLHMAMKGTQVIFDIVDHFHTKKPEAVNISLLNGDQFDTLPSWGPKPKGDVRYVPPSAISLDIIESQFARPKVDSSFDNSLFDPSFVNDLIEVDDVIPAQRPATPMNQFLT